MIFAYADPPYLGCGKLYAKFHPEAKAWDDIETHRALIEQLCDEFPDGWALSSSAKGLKPILELCPDDVRVCAWVKPWVGNWFFQTSPQYCWEPVILRGGRRKDGDEPPGWFVRDWVSANAPRPQKTPDGHFMGIKPRAFSWWIFEMLNARRDDELVDLFPGSGAVSAAWDEFRQVPVQLVMGEVHG